jgi:hypothetical protein
MAYEMVMPYHLHMPSYFLETFTEYPDKTTMQFFSLLYVLSNITTANQVFTYPRGVSGYLHL